MDKETEHKTPQRKSLFCSNKQASKTTFIIQPVTVFSKSLVPLFCFFDIWTIISEKSAHFFCFLYKESDSFRTLHRILSCLLPLFYQNSQDCRKTASVFCHFQGTFRPSDSSFLHFFVPMLCGEMWPYYIAALRVSLLLPLRSISYRELDVTSKYV